MESVNRVYLGGVSLEPFETTSNRGLILSTRPAEVHTGNFDRAVAQSARKLVLDNACFARESGTATSKNIQHLRRRSCNTPELHRNLDGARGLE